MHRNYVRVDVKGLHFLLFRRRAMDKDQSQMNHHGSLHHEKSHEEYAQQHMSSLPSEQKSLDQEADMDALEARLFAMAKSRC